MENGNERFVRISFGTGVPFSLRSKIEQYVSEQLKGLDEPEGTHCLEKYDHRMESNVVEKQIYSRFVIDKDRSSVPLDSPFSYDTQDIFYYDRLHIAPLGCKEESNRDSTRSCFNCGDITHEMSQCPRPRDSERIRTNRSVFEQEKSDLPQSRYFDHDVEASKWEHLKPGVLSTKLRNALGIASNDPPPYIVLQQILGYPPGYRWSQQICDPQHRDHKSNVKQSVDPNKQAQETTLNNPCIDTVTALSTHISCKPFLPQPPPSLPLPLPLSSPPSALPLLTPNVSINRSFLVPNSNPLNIPLTRSNAPSPLAILAPNSNKAPLQKSSEPIHVQSVQLLENQDSIDHSLPKLEENDPVCLEDGEIEDDKSQEHSVKEFQVTEDFLAISPQQRSFQEVPYRPCDHMWPLPGINFDPHYPKYPWIRATDPCEPCSRVAPVNVDEQDMVDDL